MIIGIDIGGSTTKIIGINRGAIKTPMLVKATDPMASLFGAFGKFIDANALALSDVERIMVTGAGASFMQKTIYGLPTGRVEEFLANGLGGLYLSRLKKAVIVSMGTGTSLVAASEESIEHLGGTGIGGGTILGLSGRILNIRDIDLLIRTAETGDLQNVDLLVGDITQNDLPGLPKNTTASNFGKISDIATAGDLALGILNMVFQSIGTAAFFAMQNTDFRDAVLVGNLTTIPQCREVFIALRNLYNVNFVIPEHSEYGTALGAALAYMKKKRYTEI